jgi:ADP-ribose pyrophosphatase
MRLVPLSVSHAEVPELNDKDRTVFEGKVIRVTVGSVTLPNGEQFECEHVHHPGGAVVAAQDDRKRICLLRQYRHIARQWLWELPAGRIESGEEPLETAKRELKEEAGLVARDWQSFGRAYSSPGVFDEVLHFYLARELESTTTKPDIHELLEVHWLPLDEVFELVNSSEIVDAKTLIGLCRLREILG